jgi:hypothetical protein
VENGGLVDQRRFDLSYWVWRLPPPGPITFACHWPACGIEDVRARLTRNASATPHRAASTCGRAIPETLFSLLAG